MSNFEIENSKKEKSFTSTGEKILYHKEAINDLYKSKNHPIVMHIMPTEKCNLNCVFCSVAQRGEEGKLFPDLTMEQIKHTVSFFKSMGLKAVILSGGGEPTIYPNINNLLEYLLSEELEIGLITNGLMLKNIKSIYLHEITWIRISINSLDYVDDIEIPKLKDKTTLGFSYIWNPLTSEELLQKIKNKVNLISNFNSVSYVRLLPDCNLDSEKLEEAHKLIRKVAQRLGEPFFHQYKIHQTPSECHLGRVHPVLYTDGYIYPCDSLVLNSPLEERKFHRDYALCKWDKVDNFYSKPINGSLLDTKRCPNCVFYNQNEVLKKIISKKNITFHCEEHLKHINFI